MEALKEMTTPIEIGRVYHIFNCGINHNSIFYYQENYKYFLRKYEIYMSRYWDTFAWVLMKNQFNLAIRVKGKDEITEASRKDFEMVDRNFSRKHRVLLDSLNGESTSGLPLDLTSFENLLNLALAKSPELLNHLLTWAIKERFRRFLLSYAKSVNKQQNRTGSLFQKPFRRKEIVSSYDLITLIQSIHHIPIKHRKTKSYADYKWSSFNDCMYGSDEMYCKKQVIFLFGSKDVFKKAHDEYKEVLELRERKSRYPALRFDKF